MKLNDLKKIAKVLNGELPSNGLTRFPGSAKVVLVPTKSPMSQDIYAWSADLHQYVLVGRMLTMQTSVCISMGEIHWKICDSIMQSAVLKDLGRTINYGNYLTTDNKVVYND
jgi:hypothetical protein